MGRTVTRPTLTDVFVRQGILPKQTIDQVLSRLNGVTAALGETLVSEGIISEDQLACALAAQFDLPCDLLTEFRVDQSFYDSMSVKLMQRHPFIPIAEHEGRLTIAISDPQNLLALDELELLLGR
ncbi:MAG TPA: pilus assembly protein PilB, partial [Nitrospiraceae bacterium]